MRNCNCNCRNGSDVQDFLVSVPGGTDADASYVLGLTHYTCGNRKMAVEDAAHPVKADLTATLVGTPVSVGNNAYCIECLISGTVTYKGCGCCSPRVEYVSYQCCLPCSSTTVPTITIGDVVASPKAITYYQGCCQGTYPCTNRIALTTSLNVTTA